MKPALLALTSLGLLLGGCAQHSQAWDDAWAQCQAEGIEQLETAEVDDDQRSEWLENHSQECMSEKGFEG